MNMLLKAKDMISKLLAFLFIEALHITFFFSGVLATMVASLMMSVAHFTFVAGINLIIIAILYKGLK